MKIKIYQVNRDRDFARYVSEGPDEYERNYGKLPLHSELYDCVFNGDVEFDKLEDLFYMFDGNYPSKYSGIKVEYTDVVEIEESGSIEKGFYFCDKFGFEKTEFEPEKTQLRDNRLKVVLVEPGKLARITEIGTKLEDLQKTVGGFIEAYYPFEEEVCIVCNDEGKINGMDLNRAVYGENHMIMDIIAGPFFICDCSGENFGSLNDEQLKKYTEMFRYPEMFFSVNGDIRAAKFDPRNNDRER